MKHFREALCSIFFNSPMLYNGLDQRQKFPAVIFHQAQVLHRPVKVRVDTGGIAEIIQPFQEIMPALHQMDQGQYCHKSGYEGFFCSASLIFSS